MYRKRSYWYVDVHVVVSACYFGHVVGSEDLVLFIVFFFFQAEDGIRDIGVKKHLLLAS